MVACNKAGQPESALALYDRMRAGACALSDHTIAAALVSCKASTDWQRAQAVFDGGRTSSQMCYNALFDVLAETAEWALLLTYFDKMRKAGAPRSHTPNPTSPSTRNEPGGAPLASDP